MATVLVVGCGLAGPVLAIHLKNSGFSPILFEKVSKVGDVGGTIMMAPNGFKALNIVGLSSLILQNALPTTKLENYNSAGSLLSTYDVSYFAKKYSYPIAGIRRATLHRLLVDAAVERGIPLHFSKKLEKIEEDETRVTASFSDGTQYHGSFLVACDGLHSTTRGLLFGQESPTYTGLTQTIGFGPRPTTCGDTFYNFYGLNSHIVSYGFSSTGFAWAATNREAESPETWKSLPAEEVEAFKNQSHFTKWAEPVPTMLKTANRVIKVGLYDRPALTTWFKGRCVLVGDAAHPSSPHLGQGANQALEDCMVLVKNLLAHTLPAEPISTEDLRKAFAAYESVRIPRTSALVRAALAQGQMRVVESESACVARDETVRHQFDKPAEVEKRRDDLYAVDF